MFGDLKEYPMGRSVWAEQAYGVRLTEDEKKSGSLHSEN